MSRLKIDANGRVQLPVPSLRALGREDLAVVSDSARHLLLGHADEAGELGLAGRLGDIVVADLLSFLNMFRKTGVLQFSLAGGSKTLYLQAGEVVFANSTFAEDELGAVLCEQGRLGRDQLQKVRQVSGNQAALGEQLVKKGTITARDLWLARHQQVEEIIYRLFAVHQGGFAFIARSLEGLPIDSFSLSTQNLIMEGLRRVDERALFLRRIGPLEQRVVPRGLTGSELGEAEARLLALAAEGSLNVAELVRRSGLGEFEGLRLVYQLLQKQVLGLEEAEIPRVGGRLGELVTIFNGALSALYRRILAVHPEFAQEVRLFLRDLPQPFSYVLRDVPLGDDGTCDAGRMVANLAGLDEKDQLRLIADALNELVFMECMAARRELGSEESAELIRRVQVLTGRVKNLLGRME